MTLNFSPFSPPRHSSISASRCAPAPPEQFLRRGQSLTLSLLLPPTFIAFPSPLVSWALDSCGRIAFRSSLSTSFFSPANFFPCTFSSPAIAAWCGSAWIPNRRSACCLACPMALLMSVVRAEILDVTQALRRRTHGHSSPSGGGPYRVVDLYATIRCCEGASIISRMKIPAWSRAIRSNWLNCMKSVIRCFFRECRGISRESPPESLSFAVAGGLPLDFCGSSKFWNYVPKRNVRTGCSGIFASGRCIYTR